MLQAEVKALAALKQVDYRIPSSPLPPKPLSSVLRPSEPIILSASTRQSDLRRPIITNKSVYLHLIARWILLKLQRQ